MALIVSNHYVALNLVTIYRDFGWDCATVRDILEDGSLSSYSAAAKQFRRDSIYELGVTNSDGFLLVYNFDDKQQRSEFIDLCAKFELDDGVYLAEENCLWLKKISLSGVYDGYKPVSVLLVQYVDSLSLILNLDVNQSAYFEKLSFKSAVSKSVRVSDAYVEYQQRNGFWVFVCSALSLLKTGFAHLNYFVPYKYIPVVEELHSVQVSTQVLPGLIASVPKAEIPYAQKFDVDLPYLDQSKFIPPAYIQRSCSADFHVLG